MKRTLFAVMLFCAVLPVFSQRASRLFIFPFETPETGVSANDAASIRKQIMDEILSWGSIIILEESEAESADFYVQGTIARDNNVVALTGTTYNAKTKAPLNSYREQAASTGALSARILSFCGRLAESIPLPNLLAGKWTAIINMNSGPLTCILEFKSDRTISIERYDTCEYRQGNSLTYQGFGTGTYTFNPLSRRIMTIESSGGAARESPVDGLVSINLKLEDVLSHYDTLNTGRVRLVFANNNGGFELLNAGLPCGYNFDGPSVYPDQALAYTQFTKIQ
jgi:hypothetical protein